MSSNNEERRKKKMVSGTRDPIPERGTLYIRPGKQVVKEIEKRSRGSEEVRLQEG